jgi:hypothetical protein
MELSSQYWCSLLEHADLLLPLLDEPLKVGPISPLFSQFRSCLQRVTQKANIMPIRLN